MRVSDWFMVTNGYNLAKYVKQLSSYPIVHQNEHVQKSVPKLLANVSFDSNLGFSRRFGGVRKKGFVSML